MGNGEAQQHFSEWIGATVRATFDRPLHWAQVTAVAEALLARETLSGAKVYTVMREALATMLEAMDACPLCNHSGFISNPDGRLENCACVAPLRGIVPPLVPSGADATPLHPTKPTKASSHG